MGFRYNADEDTIDIGGNGFASTKKFRDGPAGEAFGRGYDAAIFRVRPRRIVSWGLEAARRSATVQP